MFQGNAFQGDAFQVGRDAIPAQDAYTLPRAPLFTRLYSVNPLVALLATSLGMPTTLLTPAAPAVPPPTNYDWPVPRGPQRSVDLLTCTSWRFLGLQDQQPFNQTDWPNPAGPRRNPDFVQGFTPQVVAAPFAQTDWPNPRGPDFSVALRTTVDSKILYGRPVFPAVLDVPRGPQRAIDLLTSTSWRFLGLQDIQPFNQTDWPNPIGPRRNPDFIQGFTPTVVTQPFNQTDWPNPRAPARPVSDFTLPLQIQLLVPFNQVDWPNPRGAAYPTDLRYWKGERFLGLQDFIPPRQLDWPNPIRTRAEPGFVQGFTPQVVAFPFAQYDWPNPRAPSRPVVDWTLSLQIQLLVPFAQYDWPNPRGPQYPVDLRYWSSNRFLGLQDFIPPRQLDWPNPLRARAEPGFVQGFLPPAPPMPPGAQSFELARGPLFPVSLRGETRELYVGFRPLPVKPPSGYVTDNPPRAAQRSVSLYGFISCYVSPFVPPAPPAVRKPLYTRGFARFWEGTNRTIEGSVPNGALLTEDNDFILTEGGDFLLEE